MSKALNNIDLTAAQRKEVAALLQRHLPDTEVWAYGSRVKFTAKPHSDLDMVAFASKEQSQAVANLREAFEESYLPFRVDLFVWDKVPEGFHRNIEEERVVVQEKEKKNLPKEWQQVILGDVITINDATYSSKDKWPFINYLDTGNLTNGEISEIKNFIIGVDKIPSRAKRKIQPGDIVYSTVRPNQKHFGIIKDLPENLLVSTAFVTIRGKKEKADTNFVYFLLTQRETIEILQTIGEHSTSAYPSIKPSDIEALKFNLPPLLEQKAIAHILGSLDDKIELNRRMNETLEAMAQALFKSWFVDFDPVIDNALAAGNTIPDELKEKACLRRGFGRQAAIRRGLDDKQKSLPDDIRRLFPSEFAYTEEMGWIPKGWEVSKVGQQVKITGGGTPNKKDESFWSEGANAFCTPKDMSISPSTILLKTQFQLTDKGVNKVSSGKLPPGAVLISSRAPIGYLVITNIPVTINQGIIAMLKQDQFSELFLLCWAKCNMSAILSRANGSTFLEINKKNFRIIPFLVPGKDILTAFNRLTNTFIMRITSYSKQTQTLRFLRDTLLQKLLSGEVRIEQLEQMLEDRS